MALVESFYVRGSFKSSILHYFTIPETPEEYLVIASISYSIAYRSCSIMGEYVTLLQIADVV